VQHDTGLATLFRANHVAPSEFAGLQVAVMHALGALFIADVYKAPLPPSSTGFGKNVAVVRRYRDALDSIGVGAYFFQPLLTSDQITHYLVVKHALRQYWQQPQHAALLQTADQTRYNFMMVAAKEAWDHLAKIYDYPALAKQDPSLAAVFQQQHTSPAWFAPVHVAIAQALMDLIVHEADSAQYPIPDGIVGQNVAAIRPHLQALEEAGASPYGKNVVQTDGPEGAQFDGYTGRMNALGSTPVGCGFLVVHAIDPQ
jgi:hypothetical protein